MTIRQESQRTDSVSRIILAPPSRLYRAHLDAEMMANWRAPEGMRAEVLAFDGRLGGNYRMIQHDMCASEASGSNSERGRHRFTGTFAELVPDEKIVEHIQFQSADPDFAQPMIMTTMLRPVRDGTKITVECAQVPQSIPVDQHCEAIASSLRNLAMLTE